MHCTKHVTPDIIWLGGSDRRLALFENVYPIPRGVSYNAYLIQDEKTALLDTVDQAIAERFLENLEYALKGRALNYLIVNHMEPDHAAMHRAQILLPPSRDGEADLQREDACPCSCGSSASMWSWT